MSTGMEASAMRKIKTVCLLIFLAVLTLAAVGCPAPYYTDTAPPTAKTTTPSVTKTTAATTIPFTQAPQYSVLKLDAPGPSALPINGLLRPIVGQSFAQQFAACGGMPPYTWTMAAGELPPGVTLSPGGIISGVPEKAGTYSCTLVLTDAQGTSALGGTHTFYVNNPLPTATSSGGEGGPMMVVQPSFYISFPEFKYYKVNPSATWADLQKDQYLVIQPFIYGGKMPWKFTAVGLPKGLNCDPTTGLIQGTLADIQDTTPINISLILTDSTGTQAKGSPATFSLRIGYRASTVTVTQAPPATNRGTLSVSCGNGIAAVSGYGDIGRGGGIITLNAGSYVLSVRSPTTGRIVYQASIRIDAGKTTVVKWDGYVD
jgi:hypothetical protein